MTYCCTKLYFDGEAEWRSRKHKSFEINQISKNNLKINALFC